MSSGLWKRALAVLLAPSVALAASPQNPLQGSRTALGALNTSGEVFVNGSPVAGNSTLFEGDAVRTGANGAASIMFSGKGSIIVAANSSLKFSLVEGAPRYLATFESGTLGVRSLSGAREFQIRAGNFVAVMEGEVESSAEITRLADGVIRIECKRGSTGVIALEGDKAVFLKAGQAIGITPSGALVTAELAAAAPVTPPAKTAPPGKASTPPGKATTPAATATPAKPTEPAATSTGKESSGPKPQTTTTAGASKKGMYILIGVAGAGAAVAAAALAGGGGNSSRPSASPSVP